MAGAGTGGRFTFHPAPLEFHATFCALHNIALTSLPASMRVGDFWKQTPGTAHSGFLCRADGGWRTLEREIGIGLTLVLIFLGACAIITCSLKLQDAFLLAFLGFLSTPLSPGSPARSVQAHFAGTENQTGQRPHLWNGDNSSMSAIGRDNRHP